MLCLEQRRQFHIWRLVVAVAAAVLILAVAVEVEVEVMFMLRRTLSVF